MAIQTYYGSNISGIKEKFQIIPNESLVHNPSNFKIDNERFFCVKINGNAIWTPLKVNGNDETDCSLDYSESQMKIDDILLGKILEEKFKMRTLNKIDHVYNSICHLNFSWEDDVEFIDKHKGFQIQRKLIKEIALGTEKLVIIGYSFPIFNRTVDKDFIQNLKFVNKIYIQDPNCEEIKSILVNGFDIIKERENTSMPIEIILEKNTNQFLIPF